MLKPYALRSRSRRGGRVVGRSVDSSVEQVVASNAFGPHLSVGFSVWRFACYLVPVWLGPGLVVHQKLPKGPKKRLRLRKEVLARVVQSQRRLQQRNVAEPAS